jgi:hypothetical protein
MCTPVTLPPVSTVPTCCSTEMRTWSDRTACNASPNPGTLRVNCSATFWARAPGSVVFRALARQGLRLCVRGQRPRAGQPGCDRALARAGVAGEEEGALAGSVEPGEEMGQQPGAAGEMAEVDLEGGG